MTTLPENIHLLRCIRHSAPHGAFKPHYGAHFLCALHLNIFWQRLRSGREQ